MNDDDRALARYSDDLVRAIESSIGDWVESRVRLVLRAQHRSLDEPTTALIVAARLDATSEVLTELRAVLALDIDAQRKNPLSILRAAARYPTQVLRGGGAQPVERDEFEARAFPEDEFSLTPAAFSDFGPDVHDAGIVWGAAKAHVHLQRRRAVPSETEQTETVGHE